MAKEVKGYRINNRIYIFEDEAMAIPESQIGVLPDVIYVERNLVDGFKAVEANADIADLIKGYNFQTMTVNPKEWTGHTDDTLEPEPETYTITLAGAGAEYTTTDPAEAAEEGDTVTITVDTTDFALGSVAVVDADENTIETEGSAGEYTFTMPAADVTVTVNTR